jgi:hypothetical protein
MNRATLCVGAVLSSSAVAITVAVLAAPEGAIASSAAPPCTPKITKVQGHEAIDYCGPATGTLKLAGKTYNFKGGYCSTNKTQPLQLTLGTIVTGNAKQANAGLPLFQVTVDASTVVPATVNVDYAGKVLVLEGSLSVKGKIMSAVTFTGKDPVGSSNAGFSGSWNCHGVVVKTP